MHGHHRLRDPVRDRRHAQHSDPAAVRLGDLHRPDRRRKVGPRAHPIPDLVEVVPQIGLELLQIHPVHPRRSLVGLDPPPRLPDHRPGNRKRLLFGPGMLLRLLPEPTAPVERIDIPDQPAPSLHPHPSKQRSSRYYGPVRQRAPQPVLNASGFRRWHAPSRNPWRPTTPGRRFRRSPSHVPCQSRRPGSRRLYAGHRLASHRAPARLITGEQPDPPLSMPPRFMLTTPQQRTPTPPPAGRFLERLPGPHLTRQARLLPVAHHDGLQPTQHGVVWRLPRSSDAGGPTSLHLRHSTAYEDASYMTPPLRS